MHEDLWEIHPPKRVVVVRPPPPRGRLGFEYAKWLMASAGYGQSEAETVVLLAEVRRDLRQLRETLPASLSILAEALASKLDEDDEVATPTPGG